MSESQIHIRVQKIERNNNNKKIKREVVLINGKKKKPRKRNDLWRCDAHKMRI